jgi:hypothetical protein
MASATSLVRPPRPLAHHQVGYISEYPHALSAGAAVSAGGGATGLDQLFWGGRREELPGGRVVHGQVWPSVRRGV